MKDAFLTIEMLPARHGDCLWLEYGTKRKRQRVLIDGGPVDTYETLRRRMHCVPMGERAFELVVLTHVDADHVEGLVRLFAERPLPFTVKTVWFNGWRQMKQAHGLLGALQGEFLSALLVERVPRAWDAAAAPMVVGVSGKMPVKKLPGGMTLTLLSPSPKKLDRMASAWRKTILERGFSPGNLSAAWKRLAAQKRFLPEKGLLGADHELDDLLKSQFKLDPAVPNGSSIALLAEFAGKSALLLADAHPDVVADSVARLCEERGVDRLRVDAVKVAHHGSKKNTDVRLLRLLSSPRWLISTNGEHFNHPDDVCIARIIRYGAPEELCFNYLSERTRCWIDSAAQRKYGYKAIVRGEHELSLAVSL